MFARSIEVFYYLREIVVEGVPREKTECLWNIDPISHIRANTIIGFSELENLAFLGRHDHILLDRLRPCSVELRRRAFLFLLLLVDLLCCNLCHLLRLVARHGSPLFVSETKRTPADL